MGKFVLTAELKLQAPGNINSVVNNINSRLKDIQINFKLQDAGKAVAGLNDVTRAADKTSVAVNKMGYAFGVSLKRFAAFSLASRAIGLFSNRLAGAIDDAINFQDQMVRLSQITGETTKDLRYIADEIGNLATKFGVTSKSILSATDILAQAGLQANDLRVAINALAKTELAPTFGKIEDTAEGAVAILAQFGEGVGALERQLGSINRVAAQFAVESEDLISVIRRTGGVFKASGGSLEELLAVFTSVRATTRESAESIATGLRTIFTRIQRPQTIEYLKQFGVQLTDLNGKFVGPYKAVEQLSQALAQFGEGDIRFIAIAEELGGYRQIGKVIPLIRQFSLAEQARQVAVEGGTSLNEDAAKSQESLRRQFIRTQESFLKLIRDIGDTTSFQTMVKVGLNLANAFIKVADSIKPIIPLIGALAAIKFAQGIGNFASGIGAGFRQIVGPRAKNAGGKIHAFARGGLVPGSGNRDTVPAMLSPGEFVIRKSSVNKIGAGRLAAMNENRYADGGPVLASTLPSVAVQKRIKSASSKEAREQPEKFENGYYLTDTDTIIFEKKEYGLQATPTISAKNFEKKVAEKTQGKLADSPNAPVDVINSKNYGNLEVRNRIRTTSDHILLDKFLRQRIKNGQKLIENKPKKDKNLKFPDVVSVVYNTGKLFRKRFEKLNFGGFIRQYADGTTGKGVTEPTDEEIKLYKELGRVAGLKQFLPKNISAKTIAPNTRMFNYDRFKGILTEAQNAKISAEQQKAKAQAALPQYGVAILKKQIAYGNELTDTAGRKFGLKTLYMGADDSKNIQDTVVKDGAVKLINNVASYMLKGIGGTSVTGATTTPNLSGITGSIFEAALRKIDGLPDDGDPDTLNFDFPRGLGPSAAKIFGADAVKLAGLKTDAKFASTDDARESIRAKVKRDLDAIQGVQKKFFGGAIQKFAKGSRGKGVEPRNTSKRRKAYVFDFDDTLAETEARVGSQPNDPDKFAQFRGDLAGKLIDSAKATKIATMAKRRAERDHDIYVLTARPSEPQTVDAINRFMQRIGAPAKGIFGVANMFAGEREPGKRPGTTRLLSTGSKKAKVLSQISSDYDQILFLDDAVENLISAKDVPGVKPIIADTKSKNIVRSKFAVGGPVSSDTVGQNKNNGLLSLLQAHYMAEVPTSLIGKMVASKEKIRSDLENVESYYGVRNAKIIGSGAESVAFDIGKRVLKISPRGILAEWRQAMPAFDAPNIRGVARYFKIKQFGLLAAALQPKLDLDEKGRTKQATDEDLEKLREKISKQGYTWRDDTEFNSGYKRGKLRALDGIFRRADGSQEITNLPKGTYIKPEKATKFATGGPAPSDTVPALLTPGEFVINKSSAQRIGYGNLNRMNKQGVAGFAKGGSVGVQKFADGGTPKYKFKSGRASDETLGQIGQIKTAFKKYKDLGVSNANALALATSEIKNMTEQTKLYIKAETKRIDTTNKSIKNIEKANKTAEDNTKVNQPEKDANASFVKFAAFTGAVNTVGTSLIEMGKNADGTSTAFSRIAEASLGIINQVSAVIFALQQFGVSLNVKGLKEFFGGGKDSLGDKLTGGLFKKSLESSDKKSAIIQKAKENINQAKANKVDIQNQIKQKQADIQTRGEKIQRLKSAKDNSKNDLAKLESKQEADKVGLDILNQRKSNEDSVIKINKTRLNKASGPLGRITQPIGGAIKNTGAALNKIPGVSKVTSFIGGGATKIGGVAKTAGMGAISNIGGMLAKVAGPLAAIGGSAVLVSSAFNSVISAAYDYENQIKTAVEAGNAEKAAELAGKQSDLQAANTLRTVGAGAGAALGAVFGPVGSLVGAIAGAAIATGLAAAFPEFAQGVSEFFGGDTKKSVEERARADGLAAKYTLEHAANLKEADAATQQWQAGLITTEQAMMVWGRNAKNAAAAFSAEQSAVAASQANKSTGFQANLRDVFSLGGTLFENSTARNTRIDKENAARSKESFKALSTEFEGLMSGPLAKNLFATGKSGQEVMDAMAQMNPEIFAAMNQAANSSDEALSKMGKQALETAKRNAEASAKQAENQRKYLESLNLGLFNVVSGAQAAASALELIAMQGEGVDPLTKSMKVLEAATTSQAAAMDPKQIEAATQEFGNALRRSGLEESQVQKNVSALRATSQAQAGLGTSLEIARGRLQQSAVGGNPEEIKKALIEAATANVTDEQQKQTIRDRLGNINLEDSNIITQLAGGDVSGILKAASEQLTQATKEQVETGNLLAKNNQALAAIVMKRIEAEKQAIDAANEAVDVELEMAKVREQFGGTKVTSAQQRLASAQRGINILRGTGFSVGGGGAQDFARAGSQIQQELLALEKRRQTGTFTDVDKQRETQLLQAQSGLTSEAKRRLELAKEETDIVKKKVSLEKSALEKMLGGDVIGAIEDMMASSAAKILETGDAGLARAFGSKALLGGLKNLEEIGASSQTKEIAARTASSTLGLSPRMAQAFAGTTPEEKAANQQVDQATRLIEQQAKDQATLAQERTNTAIAFEQQSRAQVLGAAATTPMSAFPPVVSPAVSPEKAAISPVTQPPIIAPSQATTVTPAAPISPLIAAMPNYTPPTPEKTAPVGPEKSRGDIARDKLRANIRNAIGAAPANTAQNTANAGVGISPEVVNTFSSSVNSFVAAVDKLQNFKLNVQLDPTNININLNGGSFLNTLSKEIKNSVLDIVTQEIPKYKLDNSGKLTKGGIV